MELLVGDVGQPVNVCLNVAIGVTAHHRASDAVHHRGRGALRQIPIWTNHHRAPFCRNILQHAGQADQSRDSTEGRGRQHETKLLGQKHS